MNDSRDAFDWSSLGDAPLPDEMDDDALLRATLVQAAAAPSQHRSSRWRRPVVAAIVLLAAGVALLVLAPAWTKALMEADDDGSIAPDLEVEGEGEAAKMHARTAPPPSPAAPQKTLASVPEQPLEEPLVAPSGEVPPLDARPSTAEAGDTNAKRPKAQHRAPDPSADALLREAQDAMAAKDSAGAIRKYDVLLRKHPASAEARAARVTLGRLELNAGNAKRALAHYDAYLHVSGGSMRREAELGRIDALRELGRTDAERAAIEAFLSDHPSTVHATRLRSRLDGLR